jgi:hypothetical protein
MRCRGHQVLLGQGFQHFFVALAAADLLPAPPVESSFIAVDSGHFSLLLPWLVTPSLREITAPQASQRAGNCGSRYERIVKSAQPSGRFLKLMSRDRNN